MLKNLKYMLEIPKTGNVKKVNFGDPNMRIKNQTQDVSHSC